MARARLHRDHATWEGSLRWPTLTLCLICAACGAANNVPRMNQPAAPRADTGVILSMRTVSGYSMQEPWLAAFRANAGATSVPADTSLVEFIVRTDDGSTLSIVQPNVLKFRAGDRVVILHENETHLVPSS